jgi:hypothetical protein
MQFSAKNRNTMSFVAKNNNLFLSNSEIHVINTRHNNLHCPSCNLTIFQRGAYCSGVKVFNKLLSNIQDQVHDINKFQSAVKGFLLLHSFYSLDEYYNYVTN